MADRANLSAIHSWGERGRLPPHGGAPPRERPRSSSLEMRWTGDATANAKTCAMIYGGIAALLTRDLKAVLLAAAAGGAIGGAVSAHRTYKARVIGTSGGNLNTRFSLALPAVRLRGWARRSCVLPAAPL